MSKSFSASRMRLNGIDLIQNSATSPLVSGDNAPIGSRYSGPGGEPWFKSGATATAWAQQLMLAPYFNVKEFGAVGDGVTDDRLAVQAAINAAIAVGGGVVFFPVGVYACNVVAGSTSVFLLSGEAQGKILFLGTGRASEIVMAGNGTGNDRKLFTAQSGCKYVGYRNLRFRSALINDNEQNHLINFDNPGASAVLETGRGFVIDCYFGHTRGDAIRFLGNDTRRVANIIVKRCVFEMLNVPASRSCVSYQRATDDTTIDANYCHGSSPIDMEPTGTGSLLRHRLTRNMFFGLTSLSGNGPEENDFSIFKNNTNLIGVSQAGDGQIFGQNTRRIVISGNIVDINPAAPTPVEFAIDLIERVTDIVISNNLLLIANSTSVFSMIEISEHGVAGDNGRIGIHGNMMVNTSNAADGGGVRLRDVVGAIISGNQAHLTLSAINGFIATVDAGNLPASDIVMAGNMGAGVTSALENAYNTGSVDVDRVSVTDNFCKNMRRGVRFQTPETNLLAARNMFPSAIIGSVVLNAPLTSCPIDGIGSLTGPSTMMLVVDPEGVVTAPIGTIGLRSTGGGAGTTLYVKEAAGNTGWDAK